jgi:glycosyltransferase involved in cell wall biosynthesis
LRLASASANALVAVSKDAGVVLCATDRVSPRACQVIHNGVDVAAFAPGDRWARSPGLRAIAVGRLTRVKDHATLLRAASRVVAELPGFHLDVVGDGSERPALEALSRSLGLQGCVSFLGERQDVVGPLRDADVFTLASVSEGLSVSLLEAQASGLPAVVTSVGGNPEVVVDGTTGLLVPAGSAEGLAAALTGLLGDPARLVVMGRAARLRAERHFDLRVTVAQYESLYSGLISG